MQDADQSTTMQTSPPTWEPSSQEGKDAPLNSAEVVQLGKASRLWNTEHDVHTVPTLKPEPIYSARNSETKTVREIEYNNITLYKYT